MWAFLPLKQGPLDAFLEIEQMVNIHGGNRFESECVPVQRKVHAMFFYVTGSLLFMAAMACALTATFMTFRHYRGQMIAALRTLSLDGIHAREPVAIARRSAGLRSKLV